jgi:hypothetical protein
MDVDGGHVVISDDEDEQEEDVVAVNGAGKRKNYLYIASIFT